MARVGVTNMESYIWGVTANLFLASAILKEWKKGEESEMRRE